MQAHTCCCRSTAAAGLHTMICLYDMPTIAKSTTGIAGHRVSTKLFDDTKHKQAEPGSLTHPVPMARWRAMRPTAVVFYNLALSDEMGA